MAPSSAMLQNQPPEVIEDRISLLSVVLGELSDFEAEAGFYIEGISKEGLIVLPSGWEDRLVKFNAGENEPEGGSYGLCLDPYDLCIAKLIAGREHDLEFVGALVEAEIIDPHVAIERVRGEIEWPDDYEFDKSVVMGRVVGVLELLSADGKSKT